MVLLIEKPTRVSDSPESKVAAKNPSVKKALETAPSSTSSDLVGKPVDTFDDNGDNFIDSIEIFNANNCSVQTGDTITFQVIGGPDANDVAFATVIDGTIGKETTNIVGKSNFISVYSVQGSSDDIQFFTDNSNRSQPQPLEFDDDLEVVSSSIDCGNNNQYNDNNNNHHPHHHHHHHHHSGNRLHRHHHHHHHEPTSPQPNGERT